MNDKTAKKIVGISALAAGAYLALKGTSKKYIEQQSLYRIVSSIEALYRIEGSDLL